MNKTERIKELEGKIVMVCIQCDHMKREPGIYICRVGRSHCHSKRVQKWLDEIRKLEVENEASRSTKSG